MAGSSNQYEFPWDDEQEEHKERVFSRIARSIVDFCAEHKTFHADDLRQHVVAETGVAAPLLADAVRRKEITFEAALARRKPAPRGVVWFRDRIARKLTLPEIAELIAALQELV